MRPVRLSSAALSITLVLLVTAPAAVAQDVGNRVRVVVVGDTLTGDVTESTETGFTMTLATGLMSGYEVQRTVDYRHVEHLELRTCCMDHARVLAAAGGLLLGAGLGQLTNEKTCTDSVILLPLPASSETCTRTGNNELWGGLVGGAAGLLAGWAVLRETWEVIPRANPGRRSPVPMAGAQSRYSLEAQDAGTRVRVTIGGGVVTGDIVETSDGGFTLALPEEELREISYGDVEELEVRTCCVDYAWAYATAAGTAAGGLLAAYASDGVVCSDTVILGLFRDESCEIQGNAFWWGVIGGGVAGFTLGWTVLRDRWESAPMSGRSGPTLSPLADIGSGHNGRANLILGARIRF